MAQLQDPFARTIDYLRLSVTDRCDLRCFYCLPAGFRDFEEPEHWLTFNEIERLLRVFVGLGVKNLRITGGEPLVRKNLPELVQRLAQIPGLADLSLSTNAVRLDKFAEPLARAGINRLNVSLDSLNPERFAEITGGGKLDKVLNGLQAAKQAGLGPIKINMVALKGLNDDEFSSMLDYCITQGFTLRLIETMPVGQTGRHAQQHYLNLDSVRERLAQEFQLTPCLLPSGAGPARYYQTQDARVRIGFITPMSQHFCASCNRVRLGVDGRLYLCLGQEHSVDFRPLLRAEASDAELTAAIYQALALKPERHEFNEKPEQVLRFMAKTGG